MVVRAIAAPDVEHTRRGRFRRGRAGLLEPTQGRFRSSTPLAPVQHSRTVRTFGASHPPELIDENRIVGLEAGYLPRAATATGRIEREGSDALPIEQDREVIGGRAAGRQGLDDDGLRRRVFDGEELNLAPCATRAQLDLRLDTLPAIAGDLDAGRDLVLIGICNRRADVARVAQDVGVVVALIRVRIVGAVVGEIEGAVCVRVVAGIPDAVRMDQIHLVRISHVGAVVEGVRGIIPVRIVAGVADVVRVDGVGLVRVRLEGAVVLVGTEPVGIHVVQRVHGTLLANQAIAISVRGILLRVEESRTDIACVPHAVVVPVRLSEGREERLCDGDRGLIRQEAAALAGHEQIEERIDVSEPLNLVEAVVRVVREVVGDGRVLARNQDQLVDRRIAGRMHALEEESESSSHPEHGAVRDPRAVGAVVPGGPEAHDPRVLDREDEEAGVP